MSMFRMLNLVDSPAKTKLLERVSPSGNITPMQHRLISWSLAGTLLCAAGFFLAACGSGDRSTSSTPRLTRGQIKEWLEAAEKGDAWDKYNVGRMYRDGEGMPKSATNAAVWFRKSADAGYAKAQYHLGMAYQDGEGVAKAAAEAAQWFEKASEQGYAKAQEKLGYMQWKGEGGAKNLVTAHKWLALAAAGGEHKAAKGVKKLELSMTPQQIAEAKKLRENFTPKKLFKRPDKDKEKTK